MVASLTESSLESDSKTDILKHLERKSSGIFKISPTRQKSENTSPAYIKYANWVKEVHHQIAEEIIHN